MITHLLFSNRLFPFIGLMILFAPSHLYAQMSIQEVQKIIENGNETNLVRENSQMMQEGFFFTANLIVDKLLEINSESYNYNYRKGFILIELKKDYAAALPYLKKAITQISENYDAYNSRENKAPIDAIFHLASCYHATLEITLAKKYYKEFKKLSKTKSPLVSLADLRLIQCENAQEAMSKPLNLKLKNLGATINSANTEHSPAISVDGNALYFTSRRPWENNLSEPFRDVFLYEYPEDIYVSYLDFDSQWQEPLRLDFCKQDENEANNVLSDDERRLYIYNDISGGGDIYFSDYYKNKFNDIEFINDMTINTPYWETHCTVSSDYQTLYFVSNKPGGYGGKDIYMCTRLENNTWSKPENLGPNINGPYDEDSPFISSDNKTLYFASNGDKSIGGFDILISQLNTKNDAWGPAKNMGYPFNSVQDDIFYTTTLKGDKGYFSSQREGGFGSMDVYEVSTDFLPAKNIALFKGKVATNDNSELPLDYVMELECLDCKEENTIKKVMPRLRDGAFTATLEPCKTYSVTYKTKNDENVLYREQIKTKCDLAYQEIEKQIVLDIPNKKITFLQTNQELEPVEVATFKNIEFVHYFDYNKNKLHVKKGKLKDFINELEVQLKEGRNDITLNVYSSASTVPTRKFENNLQLAEIRAENIKYDLMTYFENIPSLKGKVNVVIVHAIVDGPEYIADGKNTTKYKPFQFVKLKTE